ncbi:hypothetical protein TcasGA2_TC002342 [Tribolium castaneum]|uniref:Uncharacterized protein n=1 Tax=Tribolium castaneum TaxID=7070 RepID=D7EJG3_TRICA|nr:hypothetical protein TcasGA2_TC002342 [Tribolium castaneum]
MRRHHSDPISPSAPSFHQIECVLVLKSYLRSPSMCSVTGLTSSNRCFDLASELKSKETGRNGSSKTTSFRFFSSSTKSGTFQSGNLPTRYLGGFFHDGNLSDDTLDGLKNFNEEYFGMNGGPSSSRWKWMGEGANGGLKKLHIYYINKV